MIWNKIFIVHSEANKIVGLIFCTEPEMEKRMKNDFKKQQQSVQHCSN